MSGSFSKYGDKHELLVIKKKINIINIDHVKEIEL